jgi:class 3 adenylate cyclase
MLVWGAMSETRKLAAILVSDVVGFSRLTGIDEQRTVARLRALRGDLVEPAVAAHHGRIVKGTGDGAIIEFRSVVDAVRCAIEMQNGLVERNAGLPPERRIEFRVGIHVGEVIEERDGDLMGDAVNIAARLEGIAKPGAICLSEDAYRQVKGRLELEVADLGATQLKNITEPVRTYLVEVDRSDKPQKPRSAPRRRLVASVATLAIVIVAGVVGWNSIVDRSSTTATSSTTPTAASSRPTVADAPATGAEPLAPAVGAPDSESNAGKPSSTTPSVPSSGETLETTPGTDNLPSSSRAQIRRPLKSVSTSQPNAEPTARRVVRSSAKANSESAQSPSGESTSDCYVSAAQTNANHASCAYLRGQAPKAEPEQPRSVETAADSSPPCSVSAAQTNANHVSCSYLRGN